METSAVARDWESVFQTWGQRPSQTEQDKCENAERAIRKAIRASDQLADGSIDILAQGSYRNRTNVRRDSDVDICVLGRDVFFFDLPERMTREDFGLTNPGNYTYYTYKDEVEQALRSHFGTTAVTRGNKAFDVHENTYRVDADVVACFEHRRYSRHGGYAEGTELHPDNGGRIINWPQQNYDNGVSKNSATGRRFKAVVRILKRLRNEMAEAGIAAATPMSSFLIECLVWNVPNEGFGHAKHKGDVRYALAHLWNETRSDDTCSEWGEINELKYLFRSVQPWTREQANAFLQAAWNYVGFE